MKERIKEASALFKEGYSCSQAIVAAYGKSFGLDKETSLKIASSLGGNCGGTGGICGAVTGALLILGLKYGITSPQQTNADYMAIQKSQMFCEEFKSRTGSLICREVYSFNLAAAKGTSHLHQDTGHCPEFVQIAAAILETMV